MNLTELRQILITRFDENELRDLCFDLQVDYDGLPGEGKTGRARELIAYLERRKRLPDLIKVGKQGRPDVSWPGATGLAQWEPEMILIPAGEFLMGSDPGRDKDASESEQPQHTLYLPDYYIARTPVTNAQYAAFVHATGHDLPEHWKSRKPPEGKGDHPMVHVSWEDAVAYCAWLSQVTGKPYRLPSEAEWEKAARGTDGRIYPWGDEPPDEGRCNSDKVRATTPVGRYSPQGDSPYGCADMAGNVWEWTRSLLGKEVLKPDFRYPYSPGDGREDLKASADILRVVRGGSWFDGWWFARCACRVGFIPGDLVPNVGIRVVASLALPPSDF